MVLAVSVNRSRYHRWGDRSSAGAHRRSESDVDVRPGSRKRPSHEQVKDRQRQRTHGANRLSRRSLDSLFTRWVTQPQRGQAVPPATAAATGGLSAVGPEGWAEERRVMIRATMRPLEPRRRCGSAQIASGRSPCGPHAGPWEARGGPCAQFRPFGPPACRLQAAVMGLPCAAAGHRTHSDSHAAQTTVDSAESLGY